MPYVYLDPEPNNSTLPLNFEMKTSQRELNQRSSKSDLTLLMMSFRKWGAEVKILLTGVTLLCFLVTLLLLAPARIFPSSSSCLSGPLRMAYNTNSTPVSITSNSTKSNDDVLEQSSSSLTIPQSIVEEGEKGDNSETKQSFRGVGRAAYTYVYMSAYRGGPNTFAVVGLASKPLDIHEYLTYTCEYKSNNSTVESSTVTGRRLNIPGGPDFARVYSVAIINCTFPSDPSSPVANSAWGGKLLLHAHTNGGFDKSLNHTDTIETLVEQPNSWSLSNFVSDIPKYDYLYCGSSLFGYLSPQRIREWIAYHVRLFGKKSHFVLHDAGGVHPDVLEVLKPWMELGYVTIRDITEQERFDSFYHNQVLVLNDCLHRYKFQTKWIFFFDVDEYVYVDPKLKLNDVMDSFKDVSMVRYDQLPMNNWMCHVKDAGQANEEWGFEKLVYRNTKEEMWRDKKYAVQPKNVFATGVHMSYNLQGKTSVVSQDVMRYFHFHGTIAEHQELCRHFENKSSAIFDNITYALDTTLKSMAPVVKSFELNTIAPTRHT